MKTPKTKTNFALVDVKSGRGALDKIVRDHEYKLPITLKGYITGTWSGDDGVSMEFEIDVTNHKLGKPIKHKCTCIRCSHVYSSAIGAKARVAAGNHDRVPRMHVAPPAKVKGIAPVRISRSSLDV